MSHLVFTEKGNRPKEYFMVVRFMLQFQRGDVLKEGGFYNGGGGIVGASVTLNAIFLALFSFVLPW